MCQEATLMNCSLPYLGSTISFKKKWVLKVLITIITRKQVGGTNEKNFDFYLKCVLNSSECLSYWGAPHYLKINYLISTPPSCIKLLTSDYRCSLWDKEKGVAWKSSFPLQNRADFGKINECLLLWIEGKTVDKGFAEMQIFLKIYMLEKLWSDYACVIKDKILLSVNRRIFLLFYCIQEHQESVTYLNALIWVDLNVDPLPLIS